MSTDRDPVRIGEPDAEAVRTARPGTGREATPLFVGESDHDCPYMGVRSCCSTDFCEDCICPDPAEWQPDGD